MIDEVDRSGVGGVSRISQAAGVITAALGVCALLGWQLDVEIMRKLLPGMFMMIPNTAVGMVSAGVALAITRAESRRPSRIVAGLAVLVLAIGAATMLERLAGYNFGIDLLFYSDMVRKYPFLPPGQMATNSTVCFTLAGIGLLCVGRDDRRLRRIRQFASSLGLTIAILALIGYLYGARPLYAIDRAAGMAFMTSLSFAVLHVGILFAPPRSLVVAVSVSPDRAGQLMRRLLVTSIAAILTLGWLWIRARDLEIVSREGGVAAFCLLIIVTIMVLVTQSAVLLQRTDTERAHHLEREVAARKRAELLQRVTATLMPLRTMQEVGSGFAQLLVDVLDADVCWVGALSEDGQYIETLGSSGVDAEVVGAWQRYSVDAALPICDALREGAAQWWESRAALVARYPGYATTVDAIPRESAAIVPLLVGSGPRAHWIGGLSIGFRATRVFDEDFKSFVLTLAQQCAQALDRSRLYEAERRAREAADRANEARRRFVASMSHELRTPLNAIGGHTQLIEMAIYGPVSERQRDALGRIDRAQRHLLKLIDDILDFAKLESGKTAYSMRPVVVADVVRGVMPLIEPQIAAKGLVFGMVLAPDVAGVALADREKLERIVLNLLANAVKFTPSFRADTGVGQIQVSVEESAELLLIRVSDSGIGIPINQQREIFEPFVQASVGLARSADGVGLGLAISRDLARGMGGDLEVESAVGAGSVFTVTLRKAKAATAAAALI
ncbi:MAG: GAF domain-containing sensor histidine kinase [bacterium]